MGKLTPNTLVTIALSAISGCGPGRVDGDADDLESAAADEGRVDLGLGCEAEMSCAGLDTCHVIFLETGLPLPPDAPIEGSVDCVVDHLLGLEPVRLGVLYSFWGEIQGGDDILVYGDGTAARRSYHVFDVVEFPYRRVEIRSRAHFEACRQSTDTNVLKECLTYWYVPDTCIGDVCCPIQATSDNACP
jgi:hypothetical protein